MRSADILILGGGIIGLTLARELHACGADLAILERGEAGREATWAAAGMLAPIGGDIAPVLEAMAMASAQMYPRYVEQLVAEISASNGNSFNAAELIDLRQKGTILIGAEAMNVPGASALSPQELRAYVPSSTWQGPASFLLEASVDPRGLSTALQQALTKRGVPVCEQAEVKKIDRESNRWRVDTSRDHWVADVVVNCCGSWAGSIAEFPTSIPTRPRKGQMAALQCDRLPLEPVVRSESVYIVPRSDGRIVLGATVEDVGFDKSVESSVVERMHREAAAIVPELNDARLVQTWAGLRPGTPDDLPIMGKVEDGLFVSTGHFRNGILLAPASARAMAQLLQGQEPEIPISDFSPARFQM